MPMSFMMTTQIVLISFWSQAKYTSHIPIRFQGLLLPVQKSDQRINSKAEQGHSRKTGQHSPSIHRYCMQPWVGVWGFLSETLNVLSPAALVPTTSKVKHKSCLTCSLPIICWIPALDPWQPSFGSWEFCWTFRGKIYLSHPNLS